MGTIKVPTLSDYMEGMLTGDFDYKLRRLNPNLWVDRQRVSPGRHQDYPICGLYEDSTFLFGVPQRYAPMYSVSGIDLRHAIKRGHQALVKQILHTGLLPEQGPIEERLLWRGYKAILADLVRRKKINRQATQRIFCVELPTHQLIFPRNFIQFTIE